MVQREGGLAWGILGTGRIAGIVGTAIRESQGARLAAVATRGAPAPELAERFPGARIISGYEALLADPGIEAVYIAGPHPTHVKWAILAAEAGKHVLCEKPLAVNAFEAMAAIEAARGAGVFLMEAMMYRFHPQIAALIDLLAADEIGEVRLIQAAFGFHKPFEAGHRLYANALAGGGILDVGCYPMSMARLVAGVTAGKPFLDPVKVAGVGHLGTTGVDEWAAASVAFPNGVLAQLSTSVALAQDNGVRITGTKGRIELADAWMGAGAEGGETAIRIIPNGGTARSMAIASLKHHWGYQIEAATKAIRAGRQEIGFPGPSLADSIGNMRALDAWRESIGLTYEFEKPGRRAGPLSGRALRHPAPGTMRHVAVPGLARAVSAVALGTADVTNMTQAGLLYDAFFEAGGTLFDTAWIYRMGLAETLFGHWLESRGVREKVTIIGKGAHTPLCYPDVISRQLAQSLERLRTGYVDIYMMHRDNPDVPVGEFVEAIDAEARAGRVRSYGFSNWSMARLDAAIAYAEAHGRMRPTALSNNFSLAEMLEPVWAGCVSSSTEEWKARLKRGDIALYAWSSQARGFFSERSAPERREVPELVRCWYSERNFERKARASELAARRGKSLMQVALAYCLHQPFPVIPLIGPLTPAELADSLGALDIRLTEAEVRWLSA